MKNHKDNARQWPSKTKAKFHEDFLQALARESIWQWGGINSCGPSGEKSA